MVNHIDNSDNYYYNISPKKVEEIIELLKMIILKLDNFK